MVVRMEKLTKLMHVYGYILRVSTELSILSQLSAQKFDFFKAYKV